LKESRKVFWFSSAFSKESYFLWLSGISNESSAK